LRTFLLGIYRQELQNGYRAIKVDGKLLYLTMGGKHQIMICDYKHGKILSKWGTEMAGKGEGEYNEPRGMCVDEKYVYVCDKLNHRIQVLTKGKGAFVTQWSKDKESRIERQFYLPYTIYYYQRDQMFYIGDTYNVQLFTKDGICWQRLGDNRHGNNMNQFSDALCISISDDKLYVSDCNNKRIQLFKLDKQD